METITIRRKNDILMRTSRRFGKGKWIYDMKAYIREDCLKGRSRPARGRRGKYGGQSRKAVTAEYNTHICIYTIIKHITLHANFNFKNRFFKAAVTTSICSNRSGPFCPMALPFCFNGMTFDSLDCYEA